MKTDDKKDNVVKIPTKNTEPNKLGNILPQVHTCFIQGLKPTIKGYYDNLDDALFDLAEKATSNDIQTKYFEAMREVRKKKELMVRKFSENIQHVFKSFKQGTFNYYNTDHPAHADSDNLSLVNEQDLDQKLATTNLIEKANTHLHQQLFNLQKRFTVLAGGTEVKIEQIPVSPAVIVDSFANTFNHLNIDDTIYIIMLKLFERSLIHNLVAPYQDINELLIKKGILPNLKFKLNNNNGNTANSGYNNTNPLNNESPNQTAPQQQTTQQVTDAQYQAIAQMLSQRNNQVASNNNLPSFEPSLINNALDVLQIEELNNLNTRAFSLSPTEIKNALLARLKDLDHEGEHKQVKQQDEDTIDLIGMLFQFLVDDRNLPDKIQALLAKLQIPYLHLALKDRSLFSNKDNNARKLLDVIAKASIGWNEVDDKKGHFIHKIESLVQHILEKDHADLNFPELIADFQKFEAKNNKKSHVLEKRTSEKALGQERILHAKNRTAEILESKMKNYPLPKIVTELLLTPWANVLILAHLRHKDEPETVANYIKFVDKLIFVSVKNKKKQATIQQINHVCSQLCKGLRLVAFDEHSINTKSKELHQILLAINGIKETEELNQQEFVTPENALHAVDEAEAPEIVHFIANRKFNNLDSEAQHIDDEFYKKAKQLQTGEWIEFTQTETEDDSIRAKLSWISPISQKLLFVNARGIKVTDKSLDELAHDLRSGLAVVLQQIPLFDRAMSAIAKQVGAANPETKSDKE